VQATHRPRRTLATSASPRWLSKAHWGQLNICSGSTSSTWSISPTCCGVSMRFVGGFLVRRVTMRTMRRRRRRRFQVHSINFYYMHMQLITLGLTDESHSQHSEHTSDGAPPAPTDIPPPDVAGDVIPMDQDDDSGEIPHKARAGKRAIVLLPSSDRGVPQAQRPRCSSSARPPVCVTSMSDHSEPPDLSFRTTVGLAGRAGFRDVFPRPGSRVPQLPVAAAPRGRSFASPSPIGHLNTRLRRRRPILRSRRQLGGSPLLVCPSWFYLHYVN
jgi:hypothetical protein